MEGFTTSTLDAMMGGLLDFSSRTSASFSDMTRSILQDLARITARMAVAGLIRTAVGFFSAPGAVSYTHLDVYKRQGFPGVARRGRAVPGQEGKGVQGPQVRGKGEPGIPDVYKRQRMGCASRRGLAPPGLQPLSLNPFHGGITSFFAGGAETQNPSPL